jgi:hypothetical protein
MKNCRFGVFHFRSYAGCRPGALGLNALQLGLQRPTTRKEAMECEPCDVLDLETEYRELDALPVVDTIRTDKVVIIDRLVAALTALRNSGTEQARREYHIILGALAPVRAAEGARAGMARRVAARIRVPRGRRARTKQQEEADEPGRPYAFLQSTIRRAAFDATVEAAKKPFRVGDAVLAKGQPGTLMGIHGRGCVVEFRVGEVYEQVTYTEMDGKAGGKGNARLTHPPPSLAPDPLAARSDGITPEIITLVRAHVEAICARSPHQRDAVCRRIATHLKQEAQALILTETRDELFESFAEKHPDVKIKRAKFYEVLPWELKEVRCTAHPHHPTQTNSTLADPWLTPG